jgi:hypothetical protein
MKNVFSPWLANLQKRVGPAPKAVPAHQVYMGHPLYKDKVTEEYWRRFPSGAQGDSIKERNKIALELFEMESDEIQEAIKGEAAEELSTARERHQRAKRGLPSDVPEEVEEYVQFLFLRTKTDKLRLFRARENLGRVIQPLIDGIRMYTKTLVTILIGSPPTEQGGSYFVKVMNSGKTTDTPVPKDFHDWDEEGFKANVVQHFVRFLSHTQGMFLLDCKSS